jgi:hypothetical protein
VHHFDVPGMHTKLRIVAEALVEVQDAPSTPECLDADAWPQLDALVASGDYWEMLMPSQFARSSEELMRLIEDLDVAAARRSADLLARAERSDLQLVRVCSQGDARGFTDRPCDRGAQGRVSGFRARHDGAGAACEDSVPLRKRGISTRARSSRTDRRRARATRGSKLCCRDWAGWGSIQPTA